jgi:hypothetical protein
MIDLWRSAIRQQFHAAIDMLAKAIEACPDSVWSGEPPRPFWYLAFHALIFLDLHLSEVDEPPFRPLPPFGLTELEDEVLVPEPAYRKRRTVRLRRALPQKVGRRNGGHDRSLGYKSLPHPVSRNEQRRTAPLQHAPRAASRRPTEHASA